MPGAARKVTFHRHTRHSALEKMLPPPSILHMDFSPRSLFLPAACVISLTGCATRPAAKTTPTPQQATAFEKAAIVLETNCVHCHGTLRLKTMPAMESTADLATMTGPGKFIIPGQPDESHLYRVITLTDKQPGAMPPTGHAVSKADVATLRTWIQSGAALPEKRRVFTPRGTAPRSS